MPEAKPADIPMIRRRYDEVRVMQKAVRGLIVKIEEGELRKSPWPSGRNCWNTLSWWLSYRRPFLKLVDGVPFEECCMKDAARRFTKEEAWREWDETTAWAERILDTFTLEQWNSDVEFWNGPAKTRRMKAWELFINHFANRLAMDWVHMLEDLATMGYRKWLDDTLGPDWFCFRPGESIEYFHPAQDPITPPPQPGLPPITPRG